MNVPAVAPYGAWKSPITSDLIVSDTISLGQIQTDGDTIYWTEMRPAEKGRYAGVRRLPDGRLEEVIPAPFNVRTRVHEYGGGSWLVSDGTIYFSNFADQRLYRQAPGEAPQPLSPAVDLRYADAVMDHRRARLICVREDHTGPGEAVNTLVGLAVEGDTDGGRVLVSGNDFYSNPCLSPDGSRLAWLTWNHPNMPWDGTELWVAAVDQAGDLAQPELVAGGQTESIFQPQWSPEGVLHFISDRSGWWNLYRYQQGQVESLCPREAEFGLPQWIFGFSTYGFLSERQIACTYSQNGLSHLARLNTASGELVPVELPYTDIESCMVQGKYALLQAGAATLPPSIVRVDLETGRYEVLRKSSELEPDTRYLSEPRPVEFPTEQGLTAHGLYYPPYNAAFSAPPGQLPPLLVKSHGGPTGSASSQLDLEIQYWTSRGFAVLDVNYGGSTGYGRAYRQRLNGNWGLVDVDDCVNGALFLVRQGLADPNRLAIDGGSAGGYTTLAALTFRQVFKAGASLYGVSDLESLAQDTHKFESRYLDNLVGAYPAQRQIYFERSPINFTPQLAVPLILLQGLEDKVVPPSQAEKMFEAVRAKGLPVAYLPFEGEQHGFRQAANIKRALDAEFYFFARIFGFEPADPIEPVKIENLA